MVKKLVIILIVILGLTVVTDAKLGDLKLLKRERFIFENSNCQITNSCSLRRIQWLIENYRVELDAGFNYGTRLSAGYETDSVDTLEEYVFVQFIRGCVYSSELVAGEIHTSYNYAQPDSAQDELMKYDNWTLESYDSDPVYNSMPDFPRHYYYRWNAMDDFFTKNETFFGIRKPSFPHLYVTDRPGTAFISQDIAKNISLEFRMCLYKSADVPESLAENEKISAEPIHCYQWSSSWIYDHGAEKYTNPYGIVDACKNKTP